MSDSKVEVELRWKISHQIYVALERLNAPMELLAAVGSYGDTLEDADVLVLLEDYNATPSPSPVGVDEDALAVAVEAGREAVWTLPEEENAQEGIAREIIRAYLAALASAPQSVPAGTFGEKLEAEEREMFRLADRLGYVCLPEPPHPDSPHAPAVSGEGWMKEAAKEIEETHFAGDWRTAVAGIEAVIRRHFPSPEGRGSGTLTSE